MSTQDRLAVFTADLLSQILAEHSQHWHRWLVGRTGGRAWGQGFHTPPGPSTHGSYPGLCPSLHFGGHRISLIPRTFLLPWLPLGSSFQTLHFFFSTTVFLFTVSLLCVWVLLCFFSRPDFLLFLFFFFMLLHVIACSTFQLRLEGIFWMALFSFRIVVHFLPGF